MAASTNTKSSGLSARFQEAAQSHPDAPALAAQGGAVSYRELDENSSRFAGHLARLGIRKSDRIALYCINAPVFPAAYFGILKAGATVVPLNLLLNPRELAFILSDSGAKALVYIDLFKDAVTAFRKDVHGLETCICIGDNRSDEKDISWAALMGEEVPAPPEPEIDPEQDIVSIIYTSGTTGQPKGAMLTHRNLLANTASAQSALEMQAGKDRVLTVLPMFHAFAATACMLTPLLHGSCVVPVPKFDPDLVAATIRETGATIFMGVPSMFASLLRLPADRVADFKSIRHCISGGAAMPVEIMKAFEEKFGILVYEGDGPTECSPVTCVNPIGGVRKPGSVGKCVPDVEMKIVDPKGSELPNGEIGEICVRGPNVMKGYWGQPEATSEAFFDEWFRTGDLGMRDDEDYFYIVDRMKDMIIVNGMNVYPRMVEEILYQYPGIREAAVVGEPSRLHGEIPVAYVAGEQDLEEAAIRAFCREHLGVHQVPRKVFFLHELPKNAAGKIVKRQLQVQGEQERGIDHRG